MNGALLALIIYLVINIIVMLTYALDKHKAINGQWRIKEKTLIILGFIGPFGAVTGMKAFHHKTQKPRFKVNYLFLFFHLIILAVIVAGLCA